MKKLISIVAAAAVMSSLAVSVSAADWSQASYADNDPTIVEIVSADKDGVTFTSTKQSPDICKARITLDKILKNRADYSKIAKMTWTVTYKGVSDKYKGDALSGGTYATCTNSDGFTLRAESTDADGNPVWEKDTYVIEDKVEFKDGTVAVEDGEMVFMDWSYADIASAGITMSITNFHIYDADGNEIEQLGFEEYDANAAEAPTEEKPAEEKPTEEPKDEVPSEEEPEAAEPAEESDAAKEDNVKTGNESTAIALAALAASSAVIAYKTRKRMI